MTEIKFSKMHGLGNDFVVIDAISQQIDLSSNTIKELSHRSTGIGFDQLLLVEAPQTEQADFRYRIFNADGSEVEHCGNGARCFVKFVHMHKLSDKNPLTVATQKGIITLTAQEAGQVRVNMGTPSFNPSDLPFLPQSSQTDIDQNKHTLSINGEAIEFGVVSIGNPHAVLRVDNARNTPVEMIGSALQNHPSFPQRVNVGFLQIINRDEVFLRVYERGAGETQACGTGACAAIAYARQQSWVSDNVVVHLSGGNLTIDYKNINDDLYMTGPTAHVYNGYIKIN